MIIIGKQIADGQLAAAEGDLYTATAITHIKSILLANTGAGTNTITLYVQPSGGTSRKIAAAALLTGETLYFDEALVLETGDKIRGSTTNATQVDYTIYGGIVQVEPTDEHGAVTLGADADVLLSLTAQEIGFDTQAANTALRGPTSGAAADPTFRAAVASDIVPALQTFQLVNEIKGWPPCVAPTADLDALNLWWDKVGTPTTAPSVVDVSAAGLTDTYELALKVTADAASEGLSQTWTYADEPRVKSGRVISALLAIWSVSAVEVTAKLVNSDASHTDASAVTAAAWTIVEIPAHTLAGTSCALQVTAGAAGTFYVVPLGASIGTRGLALPPRDSRFMNTGGYIEIYSADPGGADFTDLDLTANTSPLAWAALIQATYYSATADKTAYVRRNGASGDIVICSSGTNTSAYTSHPGTLIPLDDGQILEYKTNAAAGVTETLSLRLNGWWEWA